MRIMTIVGHSILTSLTETAGMMDFNAVALSVEGVGGMGLRIWLGISSFGSAFGTRPMVSFERQYQGT